MMVIKISVVYRLAVIALLGSLAWPALADDRWYNVEVLVFARSQDESFGQSIRQNPVQQPANAVRLNDVDNDRVPSVRSAWLEDGAWQTLDEEARVLRHMFSRMRGTGDYHLLFHEAWRQPINQKSEMPAILLDAPPNAAFGEMTAVLTFSRSRYLHVDAQVWLTPSASDEPFRNFESDEEDGQANFGNMMIQEQRRIRRDNVNYFDHPAFGMLVRITE